MRSDIIDAFSLMAKEKNIDRDILEGVIKESFQKMMEKKYGDKARFEVNVNMERGNIEIFLMREVVEEVENPDLQIDLEEVNNLGEDLEVGDDYAESIPIEDFGRRMVLNLKQNLNQKIREIEKEITFNRYKDIVGDVIVAEVYQIKPNSILLVHDNNEVMFPKSEWIPKERYRKGDTIRALIKNVEKKTTGLPTIIASRSDEQFLYKLFELEIPEIYDGIIEVKKIAREPGERAKVAVISNDERIDAVGACVGMKGIRIHSIVRELSNENIDVINFSDDPVLYIARALAPAKIDDIYIDTENKIARIEAENDQLSLIIGRNGQNIKLAAKLTGYQIDIVKREEPEEDEELDEDEDILEDEDMDDEDFEDEEGENDGEDNDDQEENDEADDEESEDEESDEESDEEELEDDDDDVEEEIEEEIEEDETLETEEDSEEEIEEENTEETEEADEDETEESDDDIAEDSGEEVEETSEDETEETGDPENKENN